VVEARDDAVTTYRLVLAEGVLITKRMQIPEGIPSTPASQLCKMCIVAKSPMPVRVGSARATMVTE
jgi:hypothetical protein